MATPNINNIEDSGLFTYGTYDSNNKILNIITTSNQISGVTGFNGTFSLGTSSAIHTVMDGFIIS